MVLKKPRCCIKLNVSIMTGLHWLVKRIYLHEQLTFVEHFKIVVVEQAEYDELFN